MTINDKVFKDSKDTRVLTATINGEDYKIVVQIAGLMPIVLADSDKIDNVYKIEKQINTMALLKGITFRDDEYTDGDRFTTIFCARSTVTTNESVGLYDAKYKDIIIFTSPADISIVSLDIRTLLYPGFSLGVAEEGEYASLKNRFAISSNTRHLPETAANLQTSSYMLALPDVNRGPNHNSYERMIGDFNTQLGSRGILNFVNVGTIGQVFTGDGKVPVYLLRQYGPDGLCISFAGNKEKAEIADKQMYLVI